MSTGQQSLRGFAVADGLLFLRTLAGMLVLVGVVALPAAVVVLGLLPEMAGYLVVAMASLTIILLGAWDSIRGQEAESTRGEEVEVSIEVENSREAVVFITILYALLAGAFSLLLVVSAALGFGAAQSGFPTAGLVLAAVYPYLDNWMTGIDERFSVVNLGGNSIAMFLRAFSVLYRIPGSLVDEARNHRRNLY